ncbi:MAG: hypothetical protein IBX50_12295 [Marinospirillum sp.]|uniref:hypothetical protein n=1 Tax=Marinospirillum sp. TaxID=2183934 RepID=UPI0019F1202B|nr:hypothetical protein [Marinospirillum sp.]MBE0507477.1 hypothetical protein [Marinospirillum sp.]
MKNETLDRNFNEEPLRGFIRLRLKAVLLLVVLSLFLGGCATNRGVLDLNVPATSSAVNPNGKTVYINSVKDNRVFEERPATPDVPSLGLGGSANSSESLKKRAIARKRNSYGKALGDILLPENKTVETVVADSLALSLSELGYTVIKNRSDITNETVIIDASIGKFWSWMNPGFWAITLTSEIETDLSVLSPDLEKKEIQVRSQGNYQVANTKNWREIMMLSLEKYKEEVKTSF